MDYVRIGLTYDLRAQYRTEGYSNEAAAKMDQQQTIAALASAIEAAGHHVVRIGHVRQLIDKLAAGERPDLVFNVCQGTFGHSREAQVPALLDAMNIPYTFSEPLVACVCLHKGWTKSLLRDAGVATCDAWTVESVDDLRRLEVAYPAFIKPIAGGTGVETRSAAKVVDAAGLLHACKELLNQFGQPILIEPYLPGREFTVSLLGSGAEAEALGTLEIVSRAEAQPADYVPRSDSDPQVAQAQRTALAAWRALGGRDAGRVDLRCDADGVPQVMQIHALPGLHPTRSALPMTAAAAGMSYESLIGRILQSALQRSGVTAGQRLQPRRPHLAIGSAVSGATGR